MFPLIRLPRLLPALLALCLTSTGRAQTTTPPADPAKPVVTEPTTHRRARAISGDLAASLAATMPKYDPPKPVEPKAEEDLPDLRETDRPKNTIIRLPKYVVREPKPPVFRERDVHTKGGLTGIAMKRYAGLNAGNVGGLNQPVALLMYQEQERLDNMAELADDAKTAKRSGDTTAADYILKQSEKTYLRQDEFGWHGGPK